MTEEMTRKGETILLRDKHNGMLVVVGWSIYGAG